MIQNPHISSHQNSLNYAAHLAARCARSNKRLIGPEKIETFAPQSRLITRVVVVVV